MLFKNTLWHRVYEKNTLVSIFKWLVPWKRGLPRPKFSFENLSPSPTLSYTIIKKPKEFFVAQKSLKVLKLLRIFIDSVVFRFHSDRTFYRFFIDGILFRVLSDRVFSDSSVMRSSSGSAVLWVINALFPSCRYFFFIKSCCYFFIKNRCFVLH